MLAFFISPYGDIIVSHEKHINIIISNPEKFGITTDYIIDTYKKYNEKIGTEGQAREEIILNLVNQGWIRLRYYRNQYWTINIGRLSTKVKDYLYDFSKYLKTIKDNSIDIYGDVRILSNYQFDVPVYTEMQDLKW